MATESILDAEELKLKEALEKVLNDKLPASANHVFLERADGPYFRAFVVSDKFAGQNAAARQTLAWDLFRSSSVPKIMLDRVFSVHPYSWDEFNREFEST